ncbi:MAG TPA: hypothetical protein VFZ53_12780 [Polyangiaceae bacterium]
MLVHAALGLSLLGFASVAHAQPTEADRTTARELAREGYDALEQKNYAVAEDRFRRADALVHAPTIVVDHARALVGMGRLVEAYERYALVLREGVPSNAPASWKQAVADAEREIETVKPRLAWLVINIEGPKEPRVTVDGREVPVASLGARRATDPGRRKVRVTADGFVSGGRVVMLKEGEEQTIAITLGRPDSVVLEETAVPKDETKPVERSTASPLPWIALGVGGAGLAVGAVTGVMALGKHADLSDSCPSGTCEPESAEERARMEDDLSEYHTLGTISGVGFAIGAVGIGTGVVLLLTSPKSESSPSAARITPLIGPGFIGIRGKL